MIRHKCSRLEAVMSWKISRDGEYTILLGNLFYYSSALRWNGLSLNQNFNITCFNLYLLFLGLPGHRCLASYSAVSRVLFSNNDTTVELKLNTSSESRKKKKTTTKKPKAKHFNAYFCKMEVFASSFISSWFNKPIEKLTNPLSSVHCFHSHLS